MLSLTGLSCLTKVWQGGTVLIIVEDPVAARYAQPDGWLIWQLGTAVVPRLMRHLCQHA